VSTVILNPACRPPSRVSAVPTGVSTPPPPCVSTFHPCVDRFEALTSFGASTVPAARVDLGQTGRCPPGVSASHPRMDPGFGVSAVPSRVDLGLASRRCPSVSTSPVSTPSSRAVDPVPRQSALHPVLALRSPVLAPTRSPPTRRSPTPGPALADPRPRASTSPRRLRPPVDSPARTCRPRSGVSSHAQPVDHPAHPRHRRPAISRDIVSDAAADSASKLPG